MARIVTGSTGGYVGASLMAIAMTLAAAPAMAQTAPTPPATPTTPGDQSTTQQTVPIAGETPASTQDATDGEQPDIVVTGFRASLNSALNVKRNETAAVDSIVAEDIGKFPDSNLAESMQRVPGVALSRGDGGEGRQVSVRGLGVVEIVLAMGVLSPLISWRVGRPLLLTAAVGLIVMEATMMTIHALSQDFGLAAVNAVLLAITVPVLLGRRRA